MSVTSRLVFLVAFAAAGASPAAKESVPPFEPTADYARQTIEGWPVYVSRQLQGDGQKAAEPALALLRVQLYEIARVLPAEAVAKLRKIPIWVEREDRGFPCMCYHPSPEWLRENGYNPDKAGGVELANVANFLTWTKDQPWMVLHEMAHGYHDLVLGYDHAAVRKAYEAAKASGRYDSVLHINGQERRHYALNNDQEYFAECTEAYFGTNDFFPFVRAELQKHDPEAFRVLRAAWGVSER